MILYTCHRGFESQFHFNLLVKVKSKKKRSRTPLNNVLRRPKKKRTIAPDPKKKYITFRNKNTYIHMNAKKMLI